MKHTTLLHVQPFNTYIKFIEECKVKIYDEKYTLHGHHVYPRFLKLKCTLSNIIVELSVEDHIHAHLLMSKCFDEGSYEYISNLRAAKLLAKNSISDKKLLDAIYESQRGENNPSKRPENKKKISDGLVEYYNNNVNPKRGKTYKEIYGEKYLEEIYKRKKVTRTNEQYKQSAAKAATTVKSSGIHKGCNNTNAKQIEIDGIVFGCMADACEYFSLSMYRLKKNKHILYKE
jgi:hypothetical protein